MRFMGRILTLLAMFLAASVSALAAPAAVEAGGTPAGDILIEEAAAAIEASASDEIDSETSLPTNVLNPDIGLTELQHRLVPLTRLELNELASQWMVIVRDQTEEVMASQVAVDRTNGAVEAEVRSQVADLVFKRNLYFKKFTAIIDALEKKGGDADVVAEYRAYHDTVLFDELRTSSVQTLLSEAQRWLFDPDGGIELLVFLGVVLAALAALWLIAKLVRRFITGWLVRFADFSQLLTNFLAGVAFWLVMVVGLAIALSLLGLDVGPVFALIGGASFILAFAFQDTLGNFASGLMIMVNRPFDEGDVVDLAGVVGKVRSVSIVATTIVTPDNQVIVLPNRNVWGNLIKNLTASDTRRVDLVFGISYEDSIDETLEVLREVTTAHPSVLQDPEPVFRVHELADSSVNFVCRPWVKTEDYWNVYWDLNQQMKKVFDERGISIPYPQHDLHIRDFSR